MEYTHQSRAGRDIRTSGRPDFQNGNLTPRAPTIEADDERQGGGHIARPGAPGRGTSPESGEGGAQPVWPDIEEHARGTGRPLAQRRMCRAPEKRGWSLTRQHALPLAKARVRVIICAGESEGQIGGSESTRAWGTPRRRMGSSRLYKRIREIRRRVVVLVSVGPAAL